jgi:hypothetical protein
MKSRREKSFMDVRHLDATNQSYIKTNPQRLKPDLFSISYVRAEARTLQKMFFAACQTTGSVPEV